MSTDPNDLVSALGQFPTSVLSDALDELDIVGGIPGVQPVLADQGIVAGWALTARFERLDRDPAAHRFGGGVGRPLEQVLRTMKAGQVVVMDLEGTHTASAWGAVLAARSAERCPRKGHVRDGSGR